ncbi:MAG TPA: OsmC family protein [Hanamia sp.]|nr:OsmC family protein [Hanamia sp.]
MKISASIKSKLNQLETTLHTNDLIKEIFIPPKASGYGSSVNGGELLLLSLAICFCNDIYREATKKNIIISDVEVIVTGDFGAEGEPGSTFKYSANVIADATDEEIKALIEHTDKVAEIHNTLRKGLNITIG